MQVVSGNRDLVFHWSSMPIDKATKWNEWQPPFWLSYVEETMPGDKNEFMHEYGKATVRALCKDLDIALWKENGNYKEWTAEIDQNIKRHEGESWDMAIIYTHAQEVSRSLDFLQHGRRLSIQCWRFEGTVQLLSWHYSFPMTLQF